MVCGSSWREEREVSLALARREREKNQFMLEDRERGPLGIKERERGSLGLKERERGPLGLA